ncbi:hypothetical protein M3685_21965 [Heyndrickxia oleronia]|uniref:hypothetical protein n=1 Tax=Heyndrickxia oleronia TaxID=38875 RepID=UPI002040B52D|nr:hypothetical protein [Heyndrickxia oleronia]MCM3456570.1 hypothetical protein [Heyndrickxia oleronia]
MKVNVNINTKKVELPKDVFDAFERFKRTGRKYQTEDELNIVLMNVVFIGHYGDLAILKQFAMKNPTAYIHAIANGYTLKNPDINEEVFELLDNWLSKSYVVDEKTDIRMFAEKLTNFYKQKLLKTS